MFRLFVQEPLSLAFLLRLEDGKECSVEKILELEPNCHTVLHLLCHLFALDLVTFTETGVVATKLSQSIIVRLREYMIKETKHD